MALSASSQAQRGGQVARQSAAIAAPLKSVFGTIIPDAPLPSDLAHLLLALRDAPETPCQKTKDADPAR